jgi:hypothetical protein
VSTDLDQLKARAEAAEKWKWTFGGLGGTPEIAWAFYKGLENNKIAWQEKAEAAEALVGELEAEINQARRAWLGDDYGHLPLIEAMEKYRTDVEAREESMQARNARLVAAGNMMRDYGIGADLDARKAWDAALADHASGAVEATPKPPADEDGLTDADFAELVQELKKEGQA